MVNDSEPRYRLVDGNGNVVGSLYAKADGTLALQEGTSGGDNELVLSTDGDVGVSVLEYINTANFSDTNDSMTADPETSSESGFIEIQVNGTTKQIPFYDP